MAKDEKAAESTEEVAPKKNKKTLIIIIVVAVLVLAIAGGAAFMLMGGKTKKHGSKHDAATEQADGSSDEADSEDEPAKEKEKTTTISFEEKFTVNLQSDDGNSHYLQVPRLELVVGSPEVAKELEESKSLVGDRISTVLRSKTMKEMLEPGSDKKLKDELKAAANEAVHAKGKKGVQEVIMPLSFIVQ